MDLIIDATSAQNKRFAGIGQYTENVVQHLNLMNGGVTTNILYDVLPYSESLRDAVERNNENSILIPPYLNRSPLFQSNVLGKLVNKGLKESVFFSPYFLNGVPNLSNVPSVVMMHDLAPMVFDYYSDKGYLYNQIRKFEYNRMIKKLLYASKVITNSNFTKSEFLKYFPAYPEENVVPIHLGISLEEVEVDTFEKYLPSDWKERGYIIYLGGGIQKNKNSAGVIKSYSKFLDLLLGSGVPKERLPYLLVAGKIFLNKNIEAKKLRNLVKGLNLEGNVIFSGYYDDKEKYSLLKNSKFFIHLSTYEGFGVAVGEAMRAGCAIIADKSSSYPEVVGDTAILVDGNDHDEVANEMFKLFNDSDIVKELGKEARERSFMFSWEKTAEQTFDVLRSVSEDI